MKYIGSTKTSFNKRWSEHIRDLNKGKHHCAYFQRAWTKYGQLDFEFLILDILEKEDCIRYEQIYFDTIDHNLLYNALYIAGAPPKNCKKRMPDKDPVLAKKNRSFAQFERSRKMREGLIPGISDETRQKMSQSRIGRKHTEESKKRMTEAQTGRVQSDETKKKLSELAKSNQDRVDKLRTVQKSNIGREISKETREKIAKANFGKHHSDESKDKISKANTGKLKSEKAKEAMSIAQTKRCSNPEEIERRRKSSTGKVHTEEQRRKQSIARIGKTHSEESKRKMSEANTGKSKTDEHKAKLSLANTGHHHSDESKLKMSEFHKSRTKESYDYARHPLSEETKLKMSEAGKNKPPMSDMSKQKLSESKTISWANRKRTEVLLKAQNIITGEVITANTVQDLCESISCEKYSVWGRLSGRVSLLSPINKLWLMTRQ